ncbi:hypothetical protein PIB30_064425 [Stylosanthes scabra]|uniref:Uncharacterized protein n=1 Tax=Stylosanthes scabra TaxID=79078 RepID=A0ABU6ZKF9_9FABA|nr:hypothetical protein [Stylosanthes scabra]
MRTHQPLEKKNSHRHTDAYAFTLCVCIRMLTAKKRGMVRTRSTSMAKGKAKLCQPPMRASPRLAALQSNIVVQIPTPTLDVPAKETVTSTLPPKKRQSFRMTGESSSRKDTKTTCRRSRRLAALHSVTKPVSEEKSGHQDQ